MTTLDEQLAHRLQVVLLHTTLAVSAGVLGMALLVMAGDLGYHGDDFDGVGAVFAVLFAVPATIVVGACLLLLRRAVAGGDLGERRPLGPATEEHSSRIVTEMLLPCRASTGRPIDSGV
jgi:hypothetical protein